MVKSCIENIVFLMLLDLPIVVLIVFLDLPLALALLLPLGVPLAVFFMFLTFEWVTMSEEIARVAVKKGKAIINENLARRLRER